MGNRGEHPTRAEHLRGRLQGVLATGAATALATAALTTSAHADPAQPQQPRTVGSTTTSAPWAVAITDDAGNQFCGGTLVTPVKVVTAAHCTQDQSNGAARPADSLRAVTGRADLRTSSGEEHEVQQIWTAPGYRSFTQGQDVAVLTLSSPAPEAPLPMVGQGETAPYAPGTAGRLYGWGRTGESEPASPQLRSVEVPVATRSYCQRAYPEVDPRGQFCAGLPQGGKDACAGDSGGPYVVGDRLVGIISYGTGCGRPGYPGVYTKLSTYADQVREQLR